MVEHPCTPQVPRARPVAELPVDVLLARAYELARSWAIALMFARPADQIGAVPLEELARGAPAVCAQVVRAVQSDAELARLTSRAPGVEEGVGPARRLPAICGARDAVSLVWAVEALRGALWEALLDALADPAADQLGNLADRLAHICSELLVGALEAIPAPALSDLRVRDARTVAPATVARGGDRAVIVDEGRAVIVDERAPGRVGSAPASPGVDHGEIEIRDQRRGEEGPAAWVGSIGAQLERFEHDCLPFAVLLVELVDLERLRRDESDAELRRLAEQLEHALRAELNEWSGSLTRERPGRCWLLAPGVDRADTELLAERLLVAVGAGASDRGTPLAVAIGTAVCPDDGRQAAALAAHADVGLYAARAATRASAVSPAAPLDEPA
jgi:GGDEF domain-containing protein